MSFKITIISGSYPPILDGVGDYTKYFFDQLSTLHDPNNVELVTTKTNDVLDEDQRIRRIVPSWSMWQMISLTRFLSQRKPDVINIQLPAVGYGRNLGPSILPYLLRRFLPGTRLVATLHEFSSRTIKGKLRLLASLRVCHDVIVVCENQHREVKSFCPSIKCQFHYVPIGATVLPKPVSSVRLDELRRNLGLQPDSPTVAHFGVIRDGKGIEYLLRAFSKLIIQFPNAKLLLIGGNHEKYLHGTVMPKLSTLKIGDNVRILGRCSESELSHYFSMADFCVQPFEDGLSTRRSSFLAPLMHGLPIVTTRPKNAFPGLAHRHNVMMVDYGNIDQLSNAMIELFMDKQLNMQLRRGAGELANDFRWEKIGQDINRVFQTSIEYALRRTHKVGPISDNGCRRSATARS